MPSKLSSLSPLSVLSASTTAVLLRRIVFTSPNVSIFSCKCTHYREAKHNIAPTRISLTASVLLNSGAWWLRAAVLTTAELRAVWWNCILFLWSPEPSASRISVWRIAEGLCCKSRCYYYEFDSISARAMFFVPCTHTFKNSSCVGDELDWVDFLAASALCHRDAAFR